MSSEHPVYAIGDLQGCDTALARLLDALPGDVGLRFVGDLINRGPNSLATLRRVIALGDRAIALLGNHDIHFLAVAAGVRKAGKHDTLDALLTAPDRDELIDWLRHRPIALQEQGCLLVHAGVLPQWTAMQVMTLAHEVEQQLRGPDWKAFLADVFGNQADRWSDDLTGIERHRVVVNALTRLRFCSADGVMGLKTKDGLTAAPKGLMPWFDAPGRKAADTTVVFGHWSTLGLMMRPNLMALDTGCVWGGKLTAARLSRDPNARELVQVNCQQYRDPLA
jgi:bis(5'-nucleosyl)-tetraphosphatase (symmetrical)